MDRDATNLQNRVIPICCPPPWCPNTHQFSAHFLDFTDTQLPWMSGYNDLTPPPPPRASGGCVRDYWLVCGGRGPSSSPTHHRSSLALFSHTPGASDSTMLHFQPRRWGKKKKNPHMIGAKSWFVTPSFPWSAPFFHLMCTIDIMVPASRFPNQKTIFLMKKKTCSRNTAFCPPSMATPPPG